MSAELEPIQEEPEIIPGRPIFVSLAVTALVIVVSGVIVWTLDAFHLRGGGRSNVETIHGLPPAQPFTTETTPEIERTELGLQLERWTWADRAHDRVRMPVGVAIDRYLEQRGKR